MDKRILSVMVSSLMAASSAVMADDHVTEITVEAQYLSNSVANSIKTPTPVIDVPQSVSIVTAEEISERGHNSIADIVNYTPGVTMAQGEGHRDAVVFRGVRSTADFFLDGVRDDVQYYRPLYNLEQVEILRGPNALLFGRGGTGGVLNRVTKKGEIGFNFNSYEAGLDNFGEYSVQIDSNTSLSGNAAFRLNAYYSELDGDRDLYDGERVGINPTLRYSPSEATNVDISYEYADHQRFIDRGIPTGDDNRPVEALKDEVFGFEGINETDLEAHIFRVAVEHKISSSMKLNVSVNYGDYDKCYQNLYASKFTDPNVTYDGYVDCTERERMSLAGNLVSEFSVGSSDHTLIVGAEYIDTSSDQGRFNSYWGDTPSTIDPARNLKNDTKTFAVGADITAVNFDTDLHDLSETDIEVQSFYIQDEISFSDSLDVVIGARFDSFDMDVVAANLDNVLDNGTPNDDTDDENVVAIVTGSTKTSANDNNISPRLGIIYKSQENISLYASYSESFLPGSGEQYATNKGKTVNGSFRHLEPDVYENTEVGMKWDAPSGVSVTLAYFESEETSASQDGNGELIESRGLTVDGVELQIQGRLTDSISFQGGLTSQDGETEKGNLPAELPKTAASLWVNNQVTDAFGFGFGFTYQDESVIKEGKDEYLPAFTRFDASARYDVSDDLRIGLHLENLTDEVYFPHAHGAHQATVGAPFTARLSISGRL